jgi:hypothetical protein
MENINIINGTSLSNLCDYSFGDQMGGLDPEQLTGGFMKEANRNNTEFLDECKKYEGKTMTLFIDNIRLYPRNIEVNAKDAHWVIHLMSTNDLLGLCSILTNNKFVIFCSHEDTPIDDQIVIPDNVLGIHAVNAGHFGGKIHPFPYGVQRPINRTNGDPDNRIQILKGEIGKKVEPSKLLYINCGIGRNVDRQNLLDFEGLDWVTTRFDKDSMFFPYSRYKDFLDEMRDHKFQICPEGHGMDCHRNWELLYMNRIPVMKLSPYFIRLMEGYPVLFVHEWSDVTKELLEKSEYLFEEVQQINMETLDLNLIYNKIVHSYEIDK